MISFSKLAAAGALFVGVFAAPASEGKFSWSPFSSDCERKLTLEIVQHECVGCWCRPFKLRVCEDEDEKWHGLDCRSEEKLDFS